MKSSNGDTCLIMPECQSAIIRAVKFYDSSSLDEDLHVQSMCASVLVQIRQVKSSDVFFNPVFNQSQCQVH